METFTNISVIWLWLVPLAIILITFRKHGLSDVKEFFYLLLTCNVLSGILVIFIAYVYLPLTIPESIYKIIKENPIK